MDAVSDMEYNPNKMNQITTSGKDGKIRVWDLRQAEQPVMEISNHSHWWVSSLCLLVFVSTLLSFGLMQSLDEV